MQCWKQPHLMRCTLCLTISWCNQSSLLLFVLCASRCALLGDQIAAMAVKNGWSGIIINGCIRGVSRDARPWQGTAVLPSRRSARRIPLRLTAREKKSMSNMHDARLFRPSCCRLSPLQATRCSPRCCADSEDIGKMALGVKALATFPLKSAWGLRKKAANGWEQACRGRSCRAG